ncbi:Late embryogenesis abundant protein LEA-2 subgroup domain-containing protein [Dioscorea alata]|uniref:Late embryogenesis abundant protein LEA-2 subgroup domain-containing protein n=1 Tax=Dioscorea alata TaxID=55571 RepID=A0ACB7US13_DIOAL|nr:Late embryogenesis abundant protein LEA-2 subgroup domain-containing protein [Dioscorea alata]
MADYKQSNLNGAYYGPAIPPSRTHRSVGRGGCDCCCFPCCLITTLLKFIFSIIITLGIIVLILWLILRPNEIKPYVETATLSTFNLSTNTNNNSTNFLTYNLTMDLSIRNPNKRISFYYDYIETQALYDDSRIGFKILDPFYQGKKNTTVLHPEFSSRTAVLGDSVVTTYKREKGEGFFYVNVKVYTRMRLKVWLFKIHGFKPEFDCSLKLPAPTSGGSSPVSTFERTKCDVRYF